MKKKEKYGYHQLKSTPCPFKAIISNTPPPPNPTPQKKTTTKKTPQKPTHKKPKNEQQKTPNKHTNKQTKP